MLYILIANDITSPTGYAVTEIVASDQYHPDVLRQTDYATVGDWWDDDLQRAIQPPPPAPPTLVEKATQARAQRDALISATDYLLMPDYPIPAEELDAVKMYRQSLRDIPRQPSFPETIVWPEKPEV